jgi:hypothetical protein
MNVSDPELSSTDTVRIMKAFHLIQKVMTQQRGLVYAGQSTSEMLHAKTLDEFLSAVPNRKNLKTLRQVAHTMNLEFTDPSLSEKLVRVNFMFGRVNEMTMAGALGFDGPELTNNNHRLQNFLRGCRSYDALVTRPYKDLTLVVPVLRATGKKLQQSMLSLQKLLNCRIEFYSIHHELQIDPFDHVWQTNARIVHRQFIDDEGIDTSTLNEEIVTYLIDTKRDDCPNSPVAKLLGARNGDVILHEPLVFGHLYGQRSLELRRVTEV